VVLSIQSLCSDDRSYPGRPAVLPDIFLADMDRDALKSILLLFQLRFCPAPPPTLKPSFAIPDTGPLSFARHFH
jgi:hypothetical protein